MQQIGNHIWQVTAGAPGPHVVIIGGTHGNELTGIEVVKQMIADVDAGSLKLLKGQLTFVMGNPKAVERGTRGSEDHADLNRMFDPERLKQPPNGSYEDERARELAALFVKTDVLLDLHSTNKPSEPFICADTTEKHEHIYRWFEARRVVWDPDHLLGKGRPVTTEEFVDLSGGVGVAYETGQAGDTTRVGEVGEQVKDVLRDVGVLRGTPGRAPKTAFEAYHMVEELLLHEDGWSWADGFGNGSWEPVKQREVVGYHGQLPHYSTMDGVILFPKIKEHWKVGKPVGFIAKRVS